MAYEPHRRLNPVTSSVETSALRHLLAILVSCWDKPDFNDDERLILAKSSLRKAGIAFVHQVVRMDILNRGAWVGYTHLHALEIEEHVWGLAGECDWDQIAQRSLREQAPHAWGKLQTTCRPFAERYRARYLSINALLSESKPARAPSLQAAWEQCSALAEGFRLEQDTAQVLGSQVPVERL